MRHNVEGIRYYRMVRSYHQRSGHENDDANFSAPPPAPLPSATVPRAKTDDQMMATLKRVARQIQRDIRNGHASQYPPYNLSSASVSDSMAIPGSSSLFLLSKDGNKNCHLQTT